MSTGSDGPSLRERKRAKTRLALLNAFVRALHRQPLEEVRIKDICRQVDVSEATFFNYFPTKTDVLVYFVQLWSLEMAWHAQRLAETHGGLAAIETVFERTADRFAKQPNVFAEILAFQAKMSSKPELGTISLAERRQAFPELEGIEAVRARELGEVLSPLLEQAIAAGELPTRIDRTAAMQNMAALFFGIPIVLRHGDIRRVGSAYRKQLELLWAGLRTIHAEETT